MSGGSTTSSAGEEVQFFCDALGCEEPADWAFIGEGGDLFICAFHGGDEPVEGWQRIDRCGTARGGATVTASLFCSLSCDARGCRRTFPARTFPHVGDHRFTRQMAEQEGWEYRRSISDGGDYCPEHAAPVVSPLQEETDNG